VDKAHHQTVNTKMKKIKQEGTARSNATSEKTELVYKKLLWNRSICRSGCIWIGV